MCECMVRLLDVEAINSKAPYIVVYEEKTKAYLFTTEHKVRYRIDFLPDDMVQSNESFQFIIQNLNNAPSPRDSAIKDTIIAIIEEFFDKNSSTLLYICETTDGMQSMRNRLFGYWLEQYKEKERFTVLSVAVKDMEGVMNYISIIIRNDNPYKEMVLQEFHETSCLLSSKPQT